MLKSRFLREFPEAINVRVNDNDDNLKSDGVLIMIIRLVVDLHFENLINHGDNTFYKDFVSFADFHQYLANEGFSDYGVIKVLKNEQVTINGYDCQIVILNDRDMICDNFVVNVWDVTSHIVPIHRCSVIEKSLSGVITTLKNINNGIIFSNKDLLNLFNDPVFKTKSHTTFLSVL